MSKFEIGDKLRCISDDGWCGSKRGDIWTFAGYYGSDERYVMFEEANKAYPNQCTNDYAVNWEFYNAFPELKSGMRIRTRRTNFVSDDDYYIVIKDSDLLVNDNGFNWLHSNDPKTGKWIGPNPNNPDSNPAWDIVEVYDSPGVGYFMDVSKRGKLIWQEEDLAKIARRKEIEEQMTALQRELDILSKD